MSDSNVGVRRTPTVKKEMNKNQLIRMREIFKPFFKALNDNCLSYVIYKCNISGRSIIHADKTEEDLVDFEFTVSGESGNYRKDIITYSFNRDDIFYNSERFVFEEGCEGLLLQAFRDVINGFNTIPFSFNRMTVENGTRWVMGIVGEDVDRKTKQVIDGYAIFLKSDMVLEEYAVPADENDVIIC